MPKELYRYAFSGDVPLEEIEASLLLAIWATESLHGESQVRLDVSHFLDTDRRAGVIDAGTAVGRDLNRLFVGFVRREFGEDTFQVERVDAPMAPAA
jgi:hypothetical protein